MLVSRRSFMTALAAAPAIGWAQRTDGPRVDSIELRRRIEALSRLWSPAGGTFADGVSRVAYSDADVAGRQYVIGLMKAAGLSPRIDPAGNIFGRRAGREASLPPILFGSHIDSVPNGGNFDGDLGSLGALSVHGSARARRAPHAPPARDGRVGGRGGRRVRPRPRLQPHRRRRRQAGGPGSGLERHASRRRHSEDRRRPGSHPRSASSRAALITRTSNSTSSKAARSRKPAFRLASSRASSRSIATTRSSRALPITPARRRWPIATTRCWPRRI